MKFFFHHSFMRGRRDQLSEEYYYFTIATLEEYLAIDEENHAEVYDTIQHELNRQLNPRWVLDFKKKNGLTKANSINHPLFREEVAAKNQLIDRLITQKEVDIHSLDNSYRKSISLGNDSDLVMVLDVLRFIAAKNSHQNVVTYIVTTIQNEGVRKAHSELIKIQRIGDKLASFIIRDVLLLDPELTTANLDYSSAFPVDTWVRKIAKSLECHNRDPEEIKSCFIVNCKRFNVNPCKFAAGLWYLGIDHLVFYFHY